MPALSPGNNSREQFEVRTPQAADRILKPTSKMWDALTRLQMPSGADIEIKLEERLRKTGPLDLSVLSL